MKKTIEDLKSEKLAIWNQKEAFRRANVDLRKIVLDTSRDRSNAKELISPATPSSCGAHFFRRPSTNRGSVTERTPLGMVRSPLSEALHVADQWSSEACSLRSEQQAVGGSPLGPAKPLLNMCWQLTAHCNSRLRKDQDLNQGARTSRGAVSVFDAVNPQLTEKGDQRRTSLISPGPPHTPSNKNLGMHGQGLCDLGVHGQGLCHLGVQGHGLCHSQPFEQYNITTQGPFVIKIGNTEKCLSVKEAQQARRVCVSDSQKAAMIVIHRRRWIDKTPLKWLDPFTSHAYLYPSLAFSPPHKQHDWDICFLEEITPTEESHKGTRGFLQGPPTRDSSFGLNSAPLGQGGFWKWVTRWPGSSSIFFIKSPSEDQETCLYHWVSNSCASIEAGADTVSWSMGSANPTKFKVCVTVADIYCCSQIVPANEVSRNLGFSGFHLSPSDRPCQGGDLLRTNPPNPLNFVVSSARSVIVKASPTRCVRRHESPRVEQHQSSPRRTLRRPGRHQTEPQNPNLHGAFLSSLDNPFFHDPQSPYSPPMNEVEKVVQQYMQTEATKSPSPTSMRGKCLRRNIRTAQPYYNNENGHAFRGLACFHLPDGELSDTERSWDEAATPDPFYADC
eukprot:GHVN01010894.1.p1 GENE.GHVN01010894.1~~GHVN01010894.1.p1  ORF type:complete len:616 (+),score=32.75 GHVN01010894.1:793-2640(+)